MWVLARCLAKDPSIIPQLVIGIVSRFLRGSLRVERKGAYNEKGGGMEMITLYFSKRSVEEGIILLGDTEKQRVKKEHLEEYSMTVN